MPGIINPYHEVAACNAANYRYFGDWQELTQDQKAILVAHYITDIMIENHKKDAENQEMERASKRKGARAKGKKT